jgi:ABC-2 type transport system ATP-binding protein
MEHETETGSQASAAMSTKSADLAATPPRSERRPRRRWVVYAPPLRPSRSGLRLAQAALLVGLLHGAVLVYWGVGGTWLLDTIGGSLEEKGRAGDAGVMLAVWAAVVLVSIASVLPLLALRRLMSPAWNRIVWRLAWAAAAILTLYGLVLTAVGLLAEAGVIPAPANAHERRALAWHAYLWDPWFLIWGLLIAAALLRGRQRPSPAATTADRARRLSTPDQHNRRAGEVPFLHDRPAAHESRARLRDRRALRARKGETVKTSSQPMKNAAQRLAARPRYYRQTHSDPDRDWPEGASSTSAIRAEGLTKRYGQTLALDALDLVVEPGEVYGYLGPNGAGKTTTIRLLLGLHRPSAGRAELFGLDAWRDPVAAHRRVAYVAGEPLLWPALTSAETLAFLARLHGGTDAAYRDLLVERFQLDTEKKIRALSKGNRQKVQLVAAFASRAELLILDEPTSGLDPLMEMAFRETVQEAKQRGQTVFLSSHILSEVEALCDRVGILRQGRLVDQGTLDQLRHLSAQTIEVTFEGPAPKLDGLSGVHVTSAGENALRFELSGSVRPLLAALAAHPVAALSSREPSLEEIFLHHYDTSSNGRGPG